MTRHTLKLTAIMSILLGAILITTGDQNVAAEEKPTADFEIIFNGKDFEGWQQKGNWVIEEGAMFRQKGGGGIRYTAKKIPDDFELRFDWKVGKRSNSGVYYRPGQYEYQILDNKEHPDGRNPRTSAASIYFCMAPSKDATKPVGEWNHGRIVCKGTVIQHWLNGVKVIDFDYSDPKWAFNVDLLKKRGADLAARSANLSLQDHGDPVWYRNIQLRELGEGDKLERSEVVPEKISEAALEIEKKKLAPYLKKKK